jgi:hypothetical protein
MLSSYRPAIRFRKSGCVFIIIEAVCLPAAWLAQLLFSNIE